MKLIISTILSISLVLIIYKSFIKKLERKLLFLKNIEEIKLSNSKIINLLISTLILTSEILVISMIISWIYRNIAILIGLLIQIFYLIILILNYNKEFKNNCNCYSSIPKKVNMKSLFNNITIIFLYLSLYVISK